MDQETQVTHRRPSGAWYEGLDGVRGLAVLLVFTVHYMGKQTHYVGWIGVMIFFVLSGFLITGILYDNRDGRDRFRNFYWRRTLRIFPLFYAVWLVVLGLGVAGKIEWRPLLWLWPAYLGNYARFIAGSTSVDHIPTVWANAPLEIGHFWSLAVEEQFYLLWPLVVFLVRRREVLVRICLGAVIAVPVMRAVLIHTAPVWWLQNEFLYRMTFTEADGFLLGGLVALVLRGPARERLKPLGPMLLGGGLLAVMVLAGAHWHSTGMSPTSAWMGEYGFSLIDLSALGLILCAIERGSMVCRAMTWRPLSLLGRYSYGFYVYHVLLGHVIAALLPANPAVAGHKLRFALLLMAEWAASFLIVFAVSALSFHVLEAPFLRLKDRFSERHTSPRPAV